MDSNDTASSPVLRPKSVMRKLVYNILHLPVPIKAPLLLLIVVLGSVLCAVDWSPESTFANRKHPLNVYLVKFSWGWTLLAVLPTVVFTSFLYSGLQLKTVLRHFGRVLIAHMIWSSVTSFFVFLDSLVGTCAIEEISKRSVCIKEGHLWTGFDISGHIFLLTYCIYVLTEEASNIQLEVWYEYNSTLGFESRAVDKLSKETKKKLHRLHRIAGVFVDYLELFAMAEVVIWTFMVMITSLYFHSILEKLLGFVFGYFAWYITYEWLFCVDSEYLPCKPSEGVFHPVKYLRVQSTEQPALSS